jgi:hypothetical protein
MRRAYPSVFLSTVVLPALFMAVLMALIAAISAPGEAAFAKSKPISWKAIDDALLRVNNVAVKDWGVYQAGKKTDPLLLQMGSRFLLIEVHDHRLLEIDSSKIERKSDDLLWDPSDRPTNPLVTSNWVVTDIGGAFQIGAKIDSEDRVLDLQLPHPANIGSLPQHATTPRQRR